MFRFGDYKAHFKHVRPEAPDDLAENFFGDYVSKSTVRKSIQKGELLPYKAKTLCTITKEGSTEVISWGVAMLSWFDVFDQQYALEKAFGRAIDNLYPKSTPDYKALRKAAWLEFAKHHKRVMGDLTKEAKTVML